MKVTIEPYNPEWPARFEFEKETILAVIGDFIEAVEHIGSTAVSGLSAKPCIDIMPGIKDFDKSKQDIVELMREAEYEYIAKYEDVIPERRLFIRANSRAVHNFTNIHIVQFQGAFWKRHLKFRNKLRADDRVRQAYQDLKLKLSRKEWAKTSDYADAKGAFIKRFEEY